MKKKLIFAILILLIILLIIVLFLMSVIGKKEITSNISQEEISEIESNLRNTSFLNCIYSKPEEVNLYYILLSCKEEETKTSKDDAEYVYLSSVNSENYSLEKEYPDIMNSKNLTDAQKKSRIIELIENELKNEQVTNNNIEDDSLGIANLSYKKISGTLAKKIMLDNLNLSEEKISEALDNLKNSSNLLYSNTYDCFYITTTNKSANTYDYDLNCISGTRNGNIYTVRYTLKLINATQEAVEFETSFYNDNGYKFISNRCITTEEMQEKAEKFEKSINNLKTVMDDNGTTYGYINSNNEEGLEYTIENGKTKAYYKLCFVKTKTNNYYFTQDVYFYLNETESKNTFLGCYPRQLMTYDFTWINDNFTRAVKGTNL